jgi:hypothetical protein
VLVLLSHCPSSSQSDGSSGFLDTAMDLYFVTIAPLRLSMVGWRCRRRSAELPNTSGSRLYDVPVGLSGSDGFRGLLDPAGFMKKDDEAGFRDHRAAGIKHGRVAMMAELGGVAQHCIGFSGFDDGRWICTS